jgi:DNA-binding transcriptional ArsR family regulator
MASIGALLADPGRCRVLLALDDGRALPAGRLAEEAGVAASTASNHLGKLVDAGLLTVQRQGRHRYYRIAGPEVGRMLEAVIQLAPPQPIRSLRQDTRAHALRQARTCYDHLAGRLGVAVMGALIERGALTGGDGTFDPDEAVDDRYSSYGHDVDYQLSDRGRAFLDDLGVEMPRGRPAIRYCVDWTEQRHHLSGALGRNLQRRLSELGWIRRSPSNRAVTLTEAGHAGLADTFGVTL